MVCILMKVLTNQLLILYALFETFIRFSTGAYFQIRNFTWVLFQVAYLKGGDLLKSDISYKNEVYQIKTIKL